MTNSTQQPFKAFSHFFATSFLIALLTSVLSAQQSRAQQLEALPDLWQTDGAVRAIETDTVNDIIYIGGDFTKVGPNNSGAVVLNAVNGSVVENLKAQRTSNSASGVVRVSVEDGLGGRFIGGKFEVVNDEPRRNLAHIDANGMLTDWNPAPNDAVHSMLLHEGKLYVGGEFKVIDGKIRHGAAAIDPVSGEIDEFNPSLNGPVYTMEVVNDSLYIGGNYGRAGIKTSGIITRETLQYLHVHKWGSLNSIYASEPDGNGGYFIGGLFNAINGEPRNNIAHIDSLGNPTDWNAGVGSSGLISTLKLDNGVLYAGGRFSEIGGKERSRAAALNPETGEVLDWNPRISGDVNCIEISNNDLFIGGSFSQVGAWSPFAAVFQGQDTELTSPLDVYPNGEVLAAVSDGNGGWYVGGDFDEYGGLPRNHLAQIDSEGQVTDWNPDVNGKVRAIAVLGNTVYLGGEFSKVAGLNRNNLAAVNAASGTPNLWTPDANGVVNAMAIQNDIVYFGGNFTSVSGTTRNRLAAVNAQSGALQVWNPNASGEVKALIVDENVVYVGGNFQTITSSSRNRIAAISTGGAVLAWNPNASSFVETLAIDGNTIYAGGNFWNIGGQSRERLAAINRNTGLATAWNPDVDNVVSSVAVKDGTVYAGGTFTAVGGNPNFSRFTAIDNTGTPIPGGTPSVSGNVKTIAAGEGNLFVGCESGFVGGDLRQNAAAIDKNTGDVKPWNPNPNGEVFAFETTENSIYLGGSFTSLSFDATTFSRSRLAETDLVAGAPTIFAPTMNNTVRAVRATATTVYAGGDFSSANGITRNRVAGLNALNGNTTTLNSNFNGSVSSLEFYEGGLFVGGNFSGSRNGIAYLNLTPGGAPVTLPPGSWGNVRAISVQNSTVFLGNSINVTTGGETRFNLAGFNLNNNELLEWSPTVIGRLYDMKATGDTLYLGGRFSSVAGNTRNHLAAVSTSSGSVLDFSMGATGFNSQVNVIDFGNDKSTLIVGGSFSGISGNTSSNSGSRNNLAAVNPLENTLLDWNPNANNPVNTLVYQPAYGNSSARIYVGGEFTTIGGESRNRLAAIRENSSVTNLQTDFLPSDVNEINHLYLSSENLFVGGSFRGAGAKDRSRIAALDANSGAALSSDISFGNTVNCMLIDGSTLYVGGEFTTANGVLRSHLAAINRTNGQLRDWNPNSNGIVYSIKAKDNLLYIGGEFTFVGAATRNRLACLSPSTGLATPWNPNADGTVRDIAIDDNVVFAGGDFTSVGGENRNKVAGINLETGALESWNPDINGSQVFSLAVDDSTVYIGGSFTEVGGIQQSNLAGVDKSSGSIKDFNPTFNQPSHFSVVTEIKIHNNIIFLGGGFWFVNDQRRNGFAAVDKVTNTVLPLVLRFSIIGPRSVRAINVSNSRLIYGGTFNRSFYNAHVGAADLNFSECEIILDCPPVEIPLPESGELLLGPDLVNNQITDCDEGLTKSYFPSTLDCSNLGENVVTATVSNQVGDTAICSFITRIVDISPPAFVDLDTLILGTQTGNCTALSADLEIPEVIDNCEVISITNDATAELPKGNNTVTWMATDAEGLTATASQIVTVIDNKAPTAVCNDITIELDADNLATITAEQLAGNSTDNCGITSISLSRDTFGIDDVGENLVTITVEDEAGLTANCVATVTVLPGEPQCNVAGGVLTTTDPRQGLCVGDEKPNLIQLSVSGNVGTGRFGLVRQSDLSIVATKASGLFDMEDFPAGDYYLGYVSVPSLSALSGVTNVGQLSGCYDLSNQLPVTSVAVNGGVITAAGPTTVCNASGSGSAIQFDVSGQQGSSFRWALLNQNATTIISSNTSGIFNLNQTAPGTYRVAHGSSVGVSFSTVNPVNLPACVSRSNTIQVNVEACEQAATLTLSPNPANEVSNVEFTVPEQEQVFLELVDMAGRTMRTVYRGMAEAGSAYRHTVNIAGLSNGIYIYRLTTADEVIIEKLMVTK